jgi:exopolysaccharide biosynthesis polyprenyl glycosylphosphotransferase
MDGRRLRRPMITEKKVRLILLYITSDVLAILCSFFYSYAFRFHAYIVPVDPVKGIPTLESYAMVFPLFLALHLAIFYLQGFYRSRLKRTQIDDFFSIVLNAVLTTLAALALLSYWSVYGGAGDEPVFEISRGFLVVYFAAVIITITFLRSQIYFFMKRRYARGLNLTNVLIVGAGDMGRALAQKLVQYHDLGFAVKGFLDDDKPEGKIIDVDGGVTVLGRLSDLDRVIGEQDIHDIYVALDLSNYARILEIFRIVNKHSVNVRLIPDLFQLLTLKANVQDLDGFPVISIDDVPLRGIRRVFKRGFDIVASAALLVALSPLFLIVALLVKMTSRGPVFYRQERVGLDARKFTIIKFRTMVCDAEACSGPVMSCPDDPRMTRIGRVLRKYSIDEFPQLANVLRGHMSLVGPRPERPAFVKDFVERIPKYMLRHKVKAGITGWAQVHGLRQDTSIEKRLEYDFFYIQNWSFSLDLKILWKTLRKGFIDKSL